MSAAATLDRWFPNARKRWGVLTSAWAMENEREAHARPVNDTEFLPAALEIMETPASPGLRILLLMLCGLFVIAVLWSVIGKLDVVAVAGGKTLPAANVKLVQPLEIGVVRAIHVREGQYVKKGQLLVELDPTVSGAEESQAGRGLLVARIDAARARAILDYLSGGSGRFVAPEGTPPAIAEVQAQLVRTVIAEYEAQRSSLIQQRSQSAAEMQATREQVRKLKDTLPLLDKQIEARRILVEKGWSSRLLQYQLEETRIERVQDRRMNESLAVKAGASVAGLNAQLRELRETFAKDAVTELAKAEDDASIRGEELRKSAQRKRWQALRSPVDGTVQQLAVHTVGGVVQPAQALMVVVPRDTNLVVEASVLNKDIGFVRERQPVRVKLEAFPFTDYGLVTGTVEHISRDAIQDEKKGLIYAARIRLNQSSISANGRDIPLGPGMAVQAEIKTGERRIIQYLLSPIARAMDEAGRER